MLFTDYIELRNFKQPCYYGFTAFNVWILILIESMGFSEIFHSIIRMESQNLFYFQKSPYNFHIMNFQFFLVTRTRQSILLY